MKHHFSILCALLTYAASAQEFWEWTKSFPEVQPIVTDCIVNGDSIYLAVVLFNGLDGTGDEVNSQLVILAGNGQELANAEILPGTVEEVASTIIRNQDGTGFHIAGSCKIGEESGLFIMPYPVDGEAGEPIFWTSADYEFATLENATLLTGGNLLLCSSMKNGIIPIPNRIALVEVAAQDGVVSDTIYGASNNPIICRHVIEWNQRIWFSVDGTLDQFGASRNSFFGTDQELGVQQWFLLPRLDEDP